MEYTWNSRKKGRKFHIATSSGTVCKYENGGNGHLLDAKSETKPSDRTLCHVCNHLYRKRQGKTKKRKRNKQSPNLPKGRGFYSSWEWAKARFEILKRFGAVCMCCGSTTKIVVDHIKPRSKYPDLELDLDNLQVLCDLCNRGKSNDDETDFRPKEKPKLVIDTECDETELDFVSLLDPTIIGQLNDLDRDFERHCNGIR